MGNLNLFAFSKAKPNKIDCIIFDWLYPQNMALRLINFHVHKRVEKMGNKTFDFSMILEGFERINNTSK